jgi:hypothetical protein
MATGSELPQIAEVGIISCSILELGIRYHVSGIRSSGDSLVQRMWVTADPPHKNQLLVSY